MGELIILLICHQSGINFFEVQCRANNDSGSVVAEHGAIVSGANVTFVQVMFAIDLVYSF